MTCPIMFKFKFKFKLSLSDFSLYISYFSSLHRADNACLSPIYSKNHGSILHGSSYFVQPSFPVSFYMQG
jgi:hypothetical protein